MECVEEGSLERRKERQAVEQHAKHTVDTVDTGRLGCSHSAGLAEVVSSSCALAR